eukprot:Phypoly_transcript_02244.p1 GENE.Phypoly_transcript_02244~~Phypoly_transcript_02244.p1  ORF type:complete len:624 (-),score=117.12 Phypoly_transcript_02244:213-2084(-)
MVDVDSVCADESRICTEDEIQAVVNSIDYANIPKVKHLLKSLGNFARQEENRAVLEQGGAAKAAKTSLEKGKGDPELLSLSSRLIGNMTYDHDENRKVFLELGVVPELLDSLAHSDHRELIRNTTGAIANLASENDAIQRQIVENNGVKVITQLLVSEHPEVQSLALRAFNNLAENGIAQAKMLEGSTLQNLVEILRRSEDQDDYVRNTTIEILTSLSSNSDIGKVLMEEYKIASTLWQILQEWLSKNSWDLEDEDGEEEAGEEVEEEKPFPVISSVLLVHMANKDPFIPYFWQENLALPILDKALQDVKASDPKTQKGKLEVVRNLGRCFALLSLHDPAISELFSNLPKIMKLAKADDPTVRMSGIMVINNLARSDDSCDQLIQQGACSAVVDAMETFPGDQRIAHVGLSALRNLSIPAKTKKQVVDSGALDLAVKHLSTMNQPIQFEAIGILKCLLLDKQTLNDENTNKFIELGGVPLILTRATNQNIDALNEAEGKDPRVMYESARLLCRLVANEEIQKNVGTAVVTPFITLLTSNFAMLKLEGAQALLIMLVKEENIPAIANEINQIAQVLTELSPTDPSFQPLSTILSQIIEFVSSKVPVDSQVTTKYSEWKAKYTPK